MSNIRSLMLLLFVITLSGCNIANIIKMRNANDDVVPRWPEKVVGIDLPTKYIGNKPFIYASVNGEENFLFMIDTGASMSYIFDTSKVVALNLKKDYSIEMGGWGDEGNSKLFKTEISSLSLGDVEFGSLSMAFLPASKTKYFMLPEEMTYDGVIGHDILRHFSWTFDRPKNQVTISKQAYVAQSNEKPIAFETSFSKILVDGEIDFGSGQVSEQEFIIDTGSRHYIKVSAAYVNNNIKLKSPPITAADFGLSGKTVHQRISTPNLKIGSRNFDWVKTNLIGPDDDEDENWVLGSGLFNQYRVVIDYHSNNMYLLSSSGSAFKSRYNLLGLELRKLISGDFVVRYVFPNFPSERSGIKAGDIISQINDVPASKISQDEWLDIASSVEEHKVCWTRDSENCTKISAQHIDGYSKQN